MTVTRDFGRTVFLLACVATVGLGWAAESRAQEPVPVSFMWETSLRGNDDVRIGWPVAVATRGSGELAVLDAEEPRVVIFEQENAAEGWLVTDVIELPAAGYDLTSSPRGFWVTLRGSEGLLLVEGPERSLTRISLPEGVVPGPVASSFAGEILLFDLAAGELLVLDGNGQKRRTVAVDGDVTSVAAGSGGSLYVAIPSESEVRRLGPNGDVLSVYTIPGRGPVPAWPGGLFVESSGEIVVVDRHTGRILILGPDGQLAGFGAGKGREPSLLDLPASVAGFADGRVAVADLGNARVQIFRRVEVR